MRFEEQTKKQRSIYLVEAQSYYSTNSMVARNSLWRWYTNNYCQIFGVCEQTHIKLKAILIFVSLGCSSVDSTQLKKLSQFGIIFHWSNSVEKVGKRATTLICSTYIYGLLCPCCCCFSSYTEVTFVYIRIAVSKIRNFECHTT